MQTAYVPTVPAQENAVGFILALLLVIRREYGLVRV